MLSRHFRAIFALVNNKCLLLIYISLFNVIGSYVMLYDIINLNCLFHQITNDFSDKEVIIRRARELVSDSLCPNPKPQTTIPCQVTCFHWMTSPIGQCSATCGGGVQHQKVWCGETGSERSDDDCDPSNKPQKMAPCNEHECPKWKYGKWGEVNCLYYKVFVVQVTCFG